MTCVGLEWKEPTPLPPVRTRPAGSRLFTRILAVAAAAMVAVGPAAHAHAAPSAADVQQQIDAAWQKLEPVIEQYNKVRSELAANQRRSAELSRRIEPLGKSVEISRTQVQEIVAGYYKREKSLSTFNALLSRGSPPTAVGDQLALVNQVADSEQRQITRLSTQQASYDADKEKVDALIAIRQRQQAQLAARKKAIDAEIKRLDALHRQTAAAEATAAAKAAADAAAARAAAAAQSAATASSTSPITSSSPLFIGGKCPAVPITGSGGVAAKTACKQIGKPYVWAANGPDSFDCSGLTQYAWASAGVQLTHYTGAQWTAGVAVSRANLRTGDLVFFYADHHHMGMYVGNGLIVHAPHTGDVVRMAQLATMPYSGARRPG
ncbi:C40 family peptidase [Micromonospora inositola]|uniref:Cell wall-associated hydrolase, NlpC family n=1 Tax=Micromonospora inositola TaxID=47865 RepID=A0A1C5H1A2_9ACTN|nr:C40 family peptidase [Micromonospora inositola]SCG39784.1 Cell wall-associated hydrolase, NlpC family [Micromonospora inositola]